MQMNNMEYGSKPLLSIGAMAQLLNIHQRTLRIYDDEKLLSPKRNKKNRRLYSYEDIEKGRLILYLTRNLAMNLSGVKAVLGLLSELNIKTSECLLLIKKYQETIM